MTTHLAKIHLQPAASTAVSEIKKLQIPAGALKFYNNKEFADDQIVKPDVLYDSAQQWLQGSGIDLNSVAEAALVHIPFYNLTYTFNNQNYTALVEASSGQVYANIYPAKSELPFRVLFIMSIAGFIVTSVICFIAAFLIDGSTEALILAEVLKIFAYGALSVPLIIMAYMLLRRR